MKFSHILENFNYVAVYVYVHSFLCTCLKLDLSDLNNLQIH